MTFRPEDYRVIRTLGEGTSAIAYLMSDDRGRKVVKKLYKRRRKDDARMKRNFLQEVEILRQLSGRSHFPTFLHSDLDRREIFMTHCGNRLSEDNAPPDWKEQLLKILRTLRKLRIYHNSSSLKNVCVLKGRIFLIDFQHSGEHRSGKRNLTPEIVSEARNLAEAFDQRLTRKTRPLDCTDGSGASIINPCTTVPRGWDPPAKIHRETRALPGTL